MKRRTKVLLAGGALLLGGVVALRGCGSEQRPLPSPRPVAFPVLAADVAPTPVQCAAHPAAPPGAGSTLTGAVDPACHRLGGFVVHWRPAETLSLLITDGEAPERVVWGHGAGQAFLAAARGDGTVHGANTAGFFRIEDAVRWETTSQQVEALTISGEALELSGTLRGGPTPVPFSLRFASQSPRRLAFEVEVGGEANRVRWLGASPADERFFGFGEQFAHVDHRGLRVPILVREQGIGRGKQPLTGILNAAQDVGGDWSHSYAPMPLALTDRGRGLVLENGAYSEFDLRAPRAVTVSLFAPRLRGHLLRGASLLELITAATEVTGRMQPLPDWMHDGAIIGTTGGEQTVLALAETLKAHDVPVSGWFLQDWVGERSTPFGTRLWWNWEPDPATYPDWSGLVQRFRDQGQRVFSYVNPFLVDAEAKGGFRRNLYAEALAKGYLVQNQAGEALAFAQGGYSAGLLDLTHPEARVWMKEVIKTQILSTGVSGWMGDFGESLPLDAKLHEGDATSFHNHYPEAWARLQQEAIAEAGQAGEVVYFSRSGYTRSPGLTRLFWAGDQLTTWDEHDGLKSSIVGLLSSGISGMSLNHSDIGGYTTIGVGPVVAIERSKELMLRWMELNAFTPVYRTHGGLHPEAGHQLDSDAETLAQFARMTKVFRALLPYRQQLMQEAADKGWPLVRHPFLHDPDPALLEQRYGFMLGSEYFVAPVTEPEAKTVDAILPRGRWVELWGGETHGDAQATTRVTLEAPIGKPAVLYREGSSEGRRLVAELERQGIR